MAQLKFTKTELRLQQIKLNQLQQYLPTLQLKKAMLQMEIDLADVQLAKEGIEFSDMEKKILGFSPLLSAQESPLVFHSIKIQEVEKHLENIAGVDVPIFETVLFDPPSYPLFDTPIWVESTMGWIKKLISIREKIKLTKEKKSLLLKELRDVSIRVNLFEKIMIPRTLENIKRIKVFLGDQQLAAVAQAKVSKKKILLRRKGKG
ncbi:MAG: V-type ATP synthase subunit D [Chlamydiae bacterium]|nr:V-type ATP synthase subunit D [Chlamydiota bacterium]